MTQSEIFNLLFNGGNFSRHFLIKLTHPTAGTLRYINNNEQVRYKNEIYKPANFEYTEPNKQGEGAKLDISATDNYEIVEWVENADYYYLLEVEGVLINGQIHEIKSYRHFYGTVSMGDDNKLSVALESDGRLDMVFTAYKYDTDLNRGNT